MVATVTNPFSGQETVTCSVAMKYTDKQIERMKRLGLTEEQYERRLAAARARGQKRKGAQMLEKPLGEARPAVKPGSRSKGALSDDEVSKLNNKLSKSSRRKKINENGYTQEEWDAKVARDIDMKKGNIPKDATLRKPRVDNPLPWQPTVTEAESEVFTEGSSFKTTMYHGTPSDERATSIMKKGFDDTHLGETSGNRGWAGEGLYFTERPEYAATYAFFGEKGVVLSTKVNMRNPWRAHFEAPVAEDFYTFIKEMQTKNPGMTQNDISRAIRKEAERRGHDGIVVYGRDGKVNELVAFHKNQVVVTGKMEAGEAYRLGR